MTIPPWVIPLAKQGGKWLIDVIAKAVRRERKRKKRAKSNADEVFDAIDSTDYGPGN
jgi:hypothetical protein